LRKAFDFAALACLVAAVASWLSGERYVHTAAVAGEESVAAAGDEESVELVEAMGSNLVPLEGGAEPAVADVEAKVLR
jgi:hypothetical protein